MRVALKAALANPWRTAVVVGVPTGALALWKRDAVSTGWTKFSTGCQNKWNNFKDYFKSAEKVDEETEEESTDASAIEESTDDSANLIAEKPVKTAK